MIILRKTISERKNLTQLEETHIRKEPRKKKKESSKDKVAQKLDFEKVSAAESA